MIKKSQLKKEKLCSKAYPTMEDLRDDMIETACNITNTKAEANVYIRILDAMIAEGKPKFEIYETMQIAFMDIDVQNYDEEPEEHSFSVFGANNSEFMQM